MVPMSGSFPVFLVGPFGDFSELIIDSMQPLILGNGYNSAYA